MFSLRKYIDIARFVNQVEIKDNIIFEYLMIFYRIYNLIEFLNVAKRNYNIISMFLKRNFYFYFRYLDFR